MDSRYPLPVRLLADDSQPAPDENSWLCKPNSGKNCSGGYVALSESNASGSTSSELFLRGALLGVIGALVAEALIGFRWHDHRPD